MAAHWKQLEDNEEKTYVEGIAVGVSLACVFLIVLFIAWCYTKHQAVSGGRSDDRPPAQRSSAPKKGRPGLAFMLWLFCCCFV